MAPSKPAVVLEPEYYQPYSCSDSGGTVYGCPRWCDTQRSVWQFLSLVQFLDVEGDVIRSCVRYAPVRPSPLGGISSSAEAAFTQSWYPLVGYNFVSSGF